MATRTVDARGKSCPGPLIDLARAVKTAASGDELHVLADDPHFPDDVRAWCRSTAHVLVDVHEEAGVHKAIVRKR